MIFLNNEIQDIQILTSFFFLGEKTPKGESTLQCVFLDITISNFLGWSNLVAYNSNAFEEYNKNEMINYIVIFPNLKKILKKHQMFNQRWTL